MSFTQRLLAMKGFSSMAAFEKHLSERNGLAAASAGGGVKPKLPSAPNSTATQRVLAAKGVPSLEALEKKRAK